MSNGVVVDTKIKGVRLVLPRGFPENLIEEIMCLVDRLFLAEALEVMLDPQAREFYSKYKKAGNFDENILGDLDKKSPGFLNKTLGKIKKRIEKIIKFKIEFLNS